MQNPTIDFLYRSLLHKMKHCTSWEGSLILNQQSLQGDAFNNLTMEKESIRREDLMAGLANLEEITGVLYISTHNLAPWLTNLAFLSKLRIIGGEPPSPSHHLPAVCIVRNAHLEYLGLSSLTAIHRSKIWVSQNEKLCFADTFDWRELVVSMPLVSPSSSSLARLRRDAKRKRRSRKPMRNRMLKTVQGVAISPTAPGPASMIIEWNRPTAECVADKQECDATVCSKDAGCWGGGPEYCRICAFWRVQDGSASRCVLNCQNLTGGYYPIKLKDYMVNNTAEEEQKASVGFRRPVSEELGVCRRCDPECGEEAGACFGPSADQCTKKCAHVKDGPFCRAYCPEGKFAHPITRVCANCAPVCVLAQRKQAPALLLVDHTPSKPMETCSGPGDWFGLGGCSACLQVNVEWPLATEIANISNRFLRCLGYTNQKQVCPDRTFRHFVIMSANVPSANQLSANDDVTTMRVAVVKGLRTDSTLAQLPEQVHTELADWLITHHRTFGMRVLRVCLPCHSECASDCLGPAPTQCRQCKTARHNGRCVDRCPSDTYSLPEKVEELGQFETTDLVERGDSSNYTTTVRMRTVIECLACHAQCAAAWGCSGPTSRDCHKCRHFTVIADTQRLQKTCVPKCPGGTSYHMESTGDSSHPLAVCDMMSQQPSTDLLPDGGSGGLLPTNGSGEMGEEGERGEPYFIINPRLLCRLSGVSIGLFCLLSLLAFLFAIFAVHACTKLVVKGIRYSGGNKALLDGLGPDRTGCCAQLDLRCHRFWMHAILVEDEEKKDRVKTAKKAGEIKSPLLSTGTSSHNQNSPKPHTTLGTEAKPNMATLLIIPEYQLQRGCLIGAGAFGSVFRGVWDQTPISFSHAVREDAPGTKLCPSPSATNQWLTDDVDGYANEEYLITGQDGVEDEKKIFPPVALVRPEVEFSLTSDMTRSLATSMSTDMSFEDEGKIAEEMGCGDGCNEKMVVAIKVLKDATDANTCKALLEEARVMATVDHPCCLRLLGLCMTARPQLITQFLPMGCLLSYLLRYSKDTFTRGKIQEERQVTPRRLLHWAGQIASGMAYLASRGIIHRDLAARNVIVEKPDQVKITDFGLAKCLEDVGSEYRAKGGRMPVKWLALECIRSRLFSSKSDVWSYGVTLWEMFMLGKKKPFEHLSARNLLQYLESGRRLCQPPMVNLELYALMIKCWHEDPDVRPEFEELHQHMLRMEKEADQFLMFELWNDSGITSPVEALTVTTHAEYTEREPESRSCSTIDDDFNFTNSRIVDSPAYLKYISPLGQNGESEEEQEEQRYVSPTPFSLTPRYGLLLPLQTSESLCPHQFSSPLASIAENEEYSSLMSATVGNLGRGSKANPGKEFGSATSQEMSQTKAHKQQNTDDEYLEPNEERLLQSFSSFPSETTHDPEDAGIKSSKPRIVEANIAENDEYLEPSTEKVLQSASTFYSK